jgi:Family of unknown function (DUF6527)
MMPRRVPAIYVDPARWDDCGRAVQDMRAGGARQAMVERKAPGSFTYSADDAGMFYICPCGCGHEGYLPFRPAPSPSWGWDGNRERPTLDPSIHHQYGTGPGGALETHWHGYLRAGMWEEC